MVENNQENLTPEQELPPLVPFDASVTAEISPNKMLAFISCRCAENDGAPLSRNMIMEAINKVNIKFGLNQDEIDNLVIKPEYDTRIEIAKGMEAENGCDGKIEYTFDTDNSHQPRERSDGTVDYYDLGLLNNVKRGDLLASIYPATEGVDGKNVLGEVIKAVKGKVLPAPFGKNVVFSDDHSKIYANIDGNVEIRQNQLSVNEAYKVSGDVGIATGNIDFVGNVTISGNILSGFNVKAGQDLIVKGIIEGSSIEAGRNMTINGGILGSPSNIITCNGDLVCKYIENVTVIVKGNLTAEYITNSNVICEGTLELIGSRGCIIGGSYVVLKKIIATNIGSAYGAVTNIQLGSYGTIQEKKTQLDKQSAEIEKNEQKLTQVINYLTAVKKQVGSLDEDKDEMLKSAIRTKTKLMIEKSTISKELAKLAGEINFLGKQNLECKGTLFRGSIINIKNTRFEANTDYKHTNFYFDDDKQEIIAGTL